MKNLLEYKGYHTKIEFDSEDLVFRGKIEGIKDLVNFESADISMVEEEFHAAVDEYLEFLDSKEMEQLKEEIKMTRLGRMLYDDGAQNGAKAKLKELVEKTMKKGFSVAEIADMFGEEQSVIEGIVKEL